MDRRTFLVFAAASHGCATLPQIKNVTPPLIKPPRLRAGDAVALIAPSGFVTEEKISGAIANLTALGLVPRLMPNIRARWGSYAGSPQARAADVQAAFDDPEVRAVWPVRGGSGCAALLPFLDYARIRRSPKVLVGYSDITALHLALLRQAGMVSFHGPVANSTFTDYTISGLRKVLFDAQSEVRYARSPSHEARAALEPAYAVRPLSPAHVRAEGPLVGGNLSVFAALIGTPFAPRLNDALIFLEDVGEAAYRVDRMLTQVNQSALEGPPAGYALGVFQRTEPQDSEPTLSLPEVLDAQFANARFAAGYGFSFGHITDQMTIPYGVRARIDTRDATLTLLEPSVT